MKTEKTKDKVRLISTPAEWAQFLSEHEYSKEEIQEALEKGFKECVEGAYENR